jgi:hypothetical protein
VNKELIPGAKSADQNNYPVRSRATRMIGGFVRLSTFHERPVSGHVRDLFNVTLFASPEHYTNLCLSVCHDQGTGLYYGIVLHVWRSGTTLCRV